MNTSTTEPTADDMSDPHGDDTSPSGVRTVTSFDDDDERFNKRNGVFYPTGHALFAFPDGRSLSAAAATLTRAGMTEDHLTLLRPQQMHELAANSQDDAGLLSRIVAAELKQMTVLAQLADAGHSFLLIRSSDEARPVLDRVGLETGASKGLLFHLLAIEELAVPRETIPGTSPFGVNEVIRTQASDAEAGR